MTPQLSIIIINYNTKEYTLECLSSLFQETNDTDIEVIVLDNASNDESVSAIEKEFGESVKLISSPENLGFAKGNNTAARSAVGEYLLLLNPDTLILENAIDKLMYFAKARPDAGIWGGRTLFADLDLNPASCWMRQTLWSLASQAFGLTSFFRNSRLFNPEGIGGWDRKGVREVDIVSGCFLLIKNKTWKDLNGFHPDFFMYGEEADLCLRAKHSGLQPIVNSQATIIHYGGASETSEPDKLIRLIKAKMLLARRHFPQYSRRLAIILLASWPLSRYLAHSLLFIVTRGYYTRKEVWKSVWKSRKEWLK